MKLVTVPLLHLEFVYQSRQQFKMANPASRQWGVTPPISVALPSEGEFASNDALIAELKKQNNFEGSEETEKR